MPLDIMAGVAITKIFDWIWKNFGENIVNSSTISLWERFEVHQAAKKYAAKRFTRLPKNMRLT
jgi:hypothetical protein